MTNGEHATQPHTEQPHIEGRAPRSGDARMRALLWVALVVCGAAYAASTIAGLPVWVAAGFGLATLAWAVTLFGDRRRRRA